MKRWQPEGVATLHPEELMAVVQTVGSGWSQWVNVKKDTFSPTTEWFLSFGEKSDNFAVICAGMCWCACISKTAVLPRLTCLQHIVLKILVHFLTWTWHGKWICPSLWICFSVCGTYLSDYSNLCKWMESPQPLYGRSIEASCGAQWTLDGMLNANSPQIGMHCVWNNPPCTK